MNQNHKIFKQNDTVALTPETVAQFRDTLHDQQALSDFLRDTERAVAFLDALSEGDDNYQNCLVEAFCKPDTIFDLVNAGKIDEIWSMILNLSKPNRQIAVLSAPEVVFILAKNNKADAVRDLIGKFPEPEQRLAVCTAPYAVFGMAKYGDTAKTLSMIQDFPAPEQRAAILSATHVVYGLVDNLEAHGNQSLISMIQQLSKEQQADVLASHLAIFGLVKNGKTANVLSWLREFTTTQQGKVRSAAYVVPILSENAAPRDLEFFIKGLPEKRDDRSRKERLSVYRSSQRHLH
ncbi:MAG: hypothetical protein ACU85E_14600 [Gammaproteobacteria bacterium]